MEFVPNRAWKGLANVKSRNKQENEQYFLTCERDWVYFTLIAVAGFWGAYTYLLRGSVFCNAQTGNVVLMGLALGSGQWRTGLYYLVPISAYVLGAFVSELAPNPVKHRFSIRWDTILMLIEMVAVLALGFVPESAPAQISQVVINFIASMQYNTFRQAEGIPMATTFCTNQLRQVGIGFAKAVRKGDREGLRRALFFLGMLGCFFLGGAASAFAGTLLSAKAIWLNLIPLGVVLVRLVHADLTDEKDQLSRKPAGH